MAFIIMTDKTTSEKQLIDEIARFREQQQSLILATTNDQGKPLSSTAPFIESDDGDFVLLLSDMAEHSQNLSYHKQSGTVAAVMLLEDEAQCRNIFARKRLSYECRVQIVDRKQPQWQPMIEQLQQKFGKTIDLLSSLGDFRLYVLSPQNGNYVKGFGQAYPLSTDGRPILDNG